MKTNFSTIDGFNKVQPLLVAHPDMTVIFCAYADITTGAFQAVKAAGLLGKVKLYDQYGNKTIVEDIRDGAVAATTGGYPKGSVDAAFLIIRNAFEGKPFDSGSSGRRRSDPRGRRPLERRHHRRHEQSGYVPSGVLSPGLDGGGSSSWRRCLASDPPAARRGVRGRQSILG